MTQVFLISAVSILVYMIGWFIAAQIRGRNDIADVAWGLGFILVALVSLSAGGTFPLRGLLVSSLVLAWGIRLALHIHSRNRGRGEDPRQLEPPSSEQTAGGRGADVLDEPAAVDPGAGGFLCDP